MKIAISLVVLLQLWLVLTNSLAIYIAIEQGYNYFNRMDESLFFLLSIVKVIVGPVAIVLLLTKREIGIKLTILLFVVYAVGMLLMPVLATSSKPMAWWYNTRQQGQGPLYTLYYVLTGGYLLWCYLKAPAIESESKM